MSGIVFIISAPSGSGKSTLTNRLLSVVSDLKFSVSYTTRPPRGSEASGLDYVFISRGEFENMVRDGAFLEHAEVFGNYYGTAKHYMDDAFAQGKDLLLDIDVQGTKQVKAKIPEAVTIFVLPPSREELEHRLRSRGQDSDEEISRRLAKARDEIAAYGKFYDYCVVNENVEIAGREVQAIVTALRCSTGRQRPRVEKLLASFGRKD